MEISEANGTYACSRYVTEIVAQTHQSFLWDIRVEEDANVVFSPAN